MADRSGRPDGGGSGDRPDGGGAGGGGAPVRGRAAAARRFDVRRVIGGLFVVYGVIVTLVGVWDSGAELAKAQGVRINLWAGLGMLGVGALFLAWQWWRPAEPPADADEPPDDGGGQ